MDRKPGSIEEIQELVRQASRLLPRGGGTKPALSTPVMGVETLDVSGLSKILEYEPDELTFTVLAGTRLSEVNDLLSEQGQYLPFDPPLSERGATLGGTLAAGLSGSGRYRYGGVRDFILGVRFVNGRGELVRGGGKVVKNAAGFDLPKLMVGSRGGLGVLVEVTFKVFPRPETFSTLKLKCGDMEEALNALGRAADSRLDVDTLDLEPARDGYNLWVRIGGFRSTMSGRLARMERLLGGSQRVESPDEDQIWRLVGEFAWVPSGWSLIKVPLTVRQIPELEKAVEGKQVLRRYIAGGQAAWLAFEDAPDSLEGLLTELGLSAVVLFGPPGMPLLGDFAGRTFYRRVRQALDPLHRFVEV